MNHRGTYALLALFFAGLCGLWLADYSKLPTPRDRDRMRSRVLAELIDAKPDDLRKLEILGGTEPMVFERRDGNRWQMTTPWDVAADPSMVETLAYNLKELTRKSETDTLHGDPSSFGLAPPERTIKLWGTGTDAPLASLEVGKNSLDLRYVRAAGSEGVEVVDARGLDLIKLPPIRWRDHELFRVPSFEVDAVRIATRDGELKLRRGPDAWRIVAPMRSLAAEARVDGLIADLGTIRVSDDSRFVADNVGDAELDRYGLKTPALTIEVNASRDGRRRPSQSIHVGKPVEGKEGQVYARRGDQPGSVLAVDSRVLKGLGVDPNAFRSPKVADVNPARVVRIGVEADGRDFEVARSGSGWTVVRPSPSSADRPAIEAFLKSLSELQTGIYLTPATAPDSGLDPPSMTLRIWQAPDPRVSTGSGSADPNGELTLSMKVGRRDAARKSIYLQIEGDRTILAVPDSAAEFLPRSPMAFRNRQVVAIAPDQVELLTLSSAIRTIRLKAPVLKLDPMTNAPIGWWMVEPVAAPADATAVGHLLKRLSGLRAEGLVAESSKPDDLKRFGLDRPVLTLTWSTFPQFSMMQSMTGPVPKPNPGTPTLENHSLLIGSPVPGRPSQRYATIEGRSLVFTLGLDTLMAFDAEFHERRVLTFDPSHVRRVHLAWPDRGFSMVLEEKGGRRDWSTEGAVDAPTFDRSRVGPLLKETSDLSTARFVQYLGDFPASAGLSPPRLALRVELDDGTPPREVRIGNSTGNGQLYATTSVEGKGSIFLLPEPLFAGWTRAPRHHDDLPDNVFAP